VRSLSRSVVALPALVACKRAGEPEHQVAGDAQQAAHYKQTYGVTWPIVAVPGSADDFARIMPSGIAGLDPGNFPLLLFLAPDRRLVAFHAGFAAPGTEGYTAATAEIRAAVEKLLASAR
jgi:hypothetical protein